MGDTQCVVVLDTNALHSVMLYLAYAEGRRLYPYGSGGWSEGDAAQIKDDIEEPMVCKGLIDGAWVLHFMHSNEVEVIRSSAVEAEVFRLDASSRALRTAVTESSVGGRWFSQLMPEEINRLLTPQDRRSIVESVDDTFTTLDGFGIRVSELDPKASSDVVWLARGVMTMVYMDPMDSVVYANALVAAATHLVTSDSKFKGVVNRFKNPASESERAYSNELASFVELCTGLKLAHHEFPVSQQIAKLTPLPSGIGS